MFSPLFIKLSLVSVGSIGLGTGGYFVYKFISKETKEIDSNLNNEIQRGEESNSPPERPATPKSIETFPPAGGTGVTQKINYKKGRDS